MPDRPRHRRPAAALLCLLLLSACASQRVDVATVPPDIFGAGQNADDVATLGARDFFNRSAGRTTNPSQAAIAIVAVEFLAGEASTSPHYTNLSGTTQVQMLQARDEVRTALAIAPGARSQQVVDALVLVGRAKDQRAQLAALADPIFTLGPQATLARLQSLPPLPVTRRALDQLGLFAFHSLDAT